MGGEKPVGPEEGARFQGSPPHGRGKVMGFWLRLMLFGITPAWAGKSAADIRKSDVWEDHPRMGGEKF